MKQVEPKPHAHVNGEREVKEEEMVEEEHVSQADYHQVSQTQVVQEVKPETVTQSETPGQAEDSEAPDLHPGSSPKPASQEPEPVESGLQQDQEEPSDSCTNETDLSKCWGADSAPDDIPLSEDGQEKDAALSSEVDDGRIDAESVQDADHEGETTSPASLKAFGPPTNPPPPPAVQQNSSAEETR